MSSFLTIIMATIFALSLVPAGAFAADDTIVVNPGGVNNTYREGRSPSDRGQITLANTKKDETYNVWRMFELASFADENPATQQHGDYDTQEAYSYLIKETVSSTPSWYTFLTTQGPKGGSPTKGTTTTPSDNPPFAVMSNDPALLTDGKLDEAKVTASGAYFVIDAESVTFNGASGYHAVRATANFSNDWDAKDSTSSRTDADGTVPSNTPLPGDATGNPDYSTAPTASAQTLPNYDRIQDFAQAAVKYGTANTSTMKPNYVETGTGDSLAGTPTSGSLVVNADKGTANPADAYGTDYDTAAGKVNTIPLGYYLVGTTMGTLAALDTTNDSVSIYEKNDEPRIEKKVLKKGAVAGAETVAQLTGATNWDENTDGDVGDYVQFRTVITAQQGAKGYKLHDVMEKGLSFVNGTLANPASVTAGTTAADRYLDKDDNTKLYGGSTAAGAVKDYNLKVYLVRDSDANGEDDTVWSIRGKDTITSERTNWTLTSPNSTDKCDFEVAFSDADGDGYDGTYEVAFAGRKFDGTTEGSTAEWVYVKDGDKIVVTYWAQITEDAVVYGTDAEGSEVSSIADNEGNTLGSAYQQRTDSDGNQRNTNATVLCYGDRSHTVKDTADVTVYQFDVAKTNESRQSGDTDWEALAGAKFQIFKARPAATGEAAEGTLDGTGYVKESANALVFEKSASGNSYLYKGDKVTSATTGLTTVLESETDNPINLRGLESWVYLLYETEAPMGYNQLAHPVVIRINPDADNDGAVPGTDSPLEGTINYQTELNSGNGQAASTNKAWDATYRLVSETYKYPTNGTEAVEDDPATTDVDETAAAVPNGGVHIVNQTGQELPSTGGIGTTIFYVAGTVLVVGAVVMLVAKRRMGSEA